MQFYEYGNKENPTILLVHGGGNSKWMFERQAKLLEKEYRVILPELDGHGKEQGTTYTSTKVEADKIVNYILEQSDGELFAIAGASLGAQIALEVVSRKEVHIKKAFLESGIYFSKNSYRKMLSYRWMIKAMTAMYEWKGLVKWSCRYYGWPVEFSDQIRNDAKALSVESNLNLYDTYFSYSIPDSLKETETDVLFLYGSKEKGMSKNDAKKAASIIKNSRVEVLDGYNHCGISLGNPEEYVAKLKKLLEQ